MMAGETAWIWAFARSIVHPGLSRPMIESHHAVRDRMRPLPGSQNIESEQRGTAISNLCPIFHAKELRRCYPDDWEEFAIQPHRTACDRGVPGEFRFPERIPDDRGRSTAARLIVCGCERTADNRTDAEHTEEVPAYEKTFRVSCL